MRIMYFVGAVIFIGFIILAIFATGGRIAFYLNIPSLIMVAGISFLLLLGNYSVREMGRCFAVGFRKGENDPLELKKASLFFTSLQNYLILSAFLGTIVGLVAILALLEDKSKIGAGMALSLITLLYGLFFNLLVAQPFKAGVKKRLIMIGENGTGTRG